MNAWPKMAVSAPTVETPLCLGLVILPAAGQQDQALAELLRHPCIDVGTPQGHRLPAVAEIVSGREETFIAELEASPAILNVAIVYAQSLEETRDGV